MKDCWCMGDHFSIDKDCPDCVDKMEKTMRAYRDVVDAAAKACQNWMDIEVCGLDADTMELKLALKEIGIEVVRSS